MDSQRPRRLTKKPTRYSQLPSLAPTESNLPDIPEVRRPKKDQCKPYLAKPIPEDLADTLPSRQREIPPYTPPLGYTQYKSGEAVTEALDELSTFFLLLSEPYL